MQITEVRIKLMDEPNDRLVAFCSVTLEECFVIRDLKLIQGKSGLFVAMPSRKLMDRCPSCQSKNHLRAVFCNQCGEHLQDDRAFKDDFGRSKLYADIAHPIHSECREHLQNEVVRAYEHEKILAKQPNYVCQYDDFGEDRPTDYDDHEWGGADQVPNFRHIDPPQGLRGEHRRIYTGKQHGALTNNDHDDFGEGVL